MEFHYKNYDRWTLGFPSPNECGLFLALLLPFCCWICFRAELLSPGRRVVRGDYFLGLAFLAAIWWILARTYSRGALVSAIGAVAIYLVLARKKDAGVQRPIVLRLAIANAALAAASTLAADLGSRFVDIAEGDRSAWNRVPLWLGGLRMLGASPWAPWGPGESGRGYMQWVQAPGPGPIYGGMVNSYLTFVLDYGIFRFAALVTSVAFLLLVIGGGLRDATAAGRAFRASLIASVLAFCIGSLFSTFWYKWYLVAAIGAVLLWGAVATAEELRSWRVKGHLAGACAVAGVVCLALLTAGLLVNEYTPGKIVRNRDGSVTLFEDRNDPATRDELIVLADNVTLGRFYGKSIRRCLAQRRGWRRITVHGPGSLPERREKCRQILILGDRVEVLDEFAQADRIVLAAPIAARDRKFSRRVSAIYLPEVPSVRAREGWTALLARDATARKLGSVGQFIAPELDGILDEMHLGIGRKR